MRLICCKVGFPGIMPQLSDWNQCRCYIGRFHIWFQKHFIYMFWSVNEIILTTKDQNIPKIERDKRAHFANCAWSQWIGHRQVGSQDKSLCLPQLTTNYYQLLFPCWPLGNSDHQTGKQKRPCCTAHHQNDDMGSKGPQVSNWVSYSLLERVFWI